MAVSMVLYVDAHWCSPWTGAVHVGLREKGLTFTTAVAMVRPSVGAVDAMHERTVTGTAPVLHAGALWLAESQAIVEYLEEAFPAPAWPRLLPADLAARARARQVMCWLRSSHEALRRERPMERLMYRRAAPAASLSAPARHSAAELIRAAERLGATAAGALFGAFSIVDVDLALSLWRVAAELPLPAAVAAYVDAVLARPSVREFIDHPRPPFLPPSD